MQNRKNVTTGLEIWSFVLKRKCLGQRRLPFYFKKKKSREEIVTFLPLTPNLVINIFIFKRNVCLPRADLPLRFFLPRPVIGGG